MFVFIITFLNLYKQKAFAKNNKQYNKRKEIHLSLVIIIVKFMKRFRV